MTPTELEQLREPKISRWQTIILPRHPSGAAFRKEHRIEERKVPRSHDDRALPAEQKLEHWYGQIGTSAVVAARRFATCGKHTSKDQRLRTAKKMSEDIAA
jgi:hypothetical protein